MSDFYHLSRIYVFLVVKIRERKSEKRQQTPHKAGEQALCDNGHKYLLQRLQEILGKI